MSSGSESTRNTPSPPSPWRVFSTTGYPVYSAICSAPTSGVTSIVLGMGISGITWLATWNVLSLSDVMSLHSAGLMQSAPFPSSMRSTAFR